MCIKVHVYAYKISKEQKHTSSVCPSCATLFSSSKINPVFHNPCTKTEAFHFLAVLMFIYQHLLHLSIRQLCSKHCHKSPFGQLRLDGHYSSSTSCACTYAEGGLFPVPLVCQRKPKTGLLCFLQFFTHITLCVRLLLIFKAHPHFYAHLFLPPSSILLFGVCFAFKKHTYSYVRRQG